MNKAERILELLDLYENRDKYACLMIDVNTDEVREKFLGLRNKIKKEDFYEKDNSWVNTFHTTALFGLKDNDLDQVKEILKTYPMIKLTVKNEIGVFDNSEKMEYQVIYLPVESSDLVKLNKELTEKTKTEAPTFKTYKPHLTIAYVLPGKKTDYTVDFDSIEFEAKEADFSTTTNEHTLIKLG